MNQDTDLLQKAKALRAEIATDLLRLPHRCPFRPILKFARRLAIWCETSARKNLEDQLR